MKTYMKIQTIFLLMLSIGLFSACTDGFEDLNTSNQLVTEELIDVDMLFARVEASAIHWDAPVGNGTIGNYAGMSTSGANRPFAVGDSPGVWNSYYGNYGRNLADIIRICNKRNEENGDNALDNKIAMARILLAWATAKVTDTYGDIPYSESFLPQEEAVLQPKYDTQKSIYEDILKELKEAAAQLDASLETYGSADLIYGGDVTKWKKLANSLRLRYAMRVRYVDPQLAESNMSDLSETDLIISSDDDAVILTATDYPNNWNDLYDGLINSGYPSSNHRVQKTFIDILIGGGDAHSPIDPRIAVYADTAWAQWPGTVNYKDIDNFGYRGTPLLGVVPVEEKYPWGSSSVSQWSAFAYAAVVERPLYRSSETWFTLAEAALVGLNSGDAEQFYQNGIDEGIAWVQRWYEMAMPQLTKIAADNKVLLQIYYSQVYPDYYNDRDEAWEAEYFAEKQITLEEIDAFKASNVYQLTGSVEENLEKIIEQKIISLWPNEYEGWSEWRRTGYPRILIGSDDDVLQGTIPRRMPWPEQEQQVNSDNYNVALERLGGEDGRLVKIWWDANPTAPHEHQGTVPTMDHPWVQ